MAHPVRACALAAGLLAAALCGAVQAAPYQPAPGVQGTLRIWGSPADAALLAQWEQALRQAQPGLRLALSLHGPDSAMAGIYTDVADLAFIGRELRVPVENMAFEWVKLRKPVSVDVANAGITTDRLAANYAVFVHPDNPLAKLTLAQLDAVFGAEHKRGASNARTWGDLGLTGSWGPRPIRVLAPPVDSVAALHFRKLVLKDSFKWNPDLEEVGNPTQALKALAGDPAALVYAPMAAALPGVRALPLALDAASPPVALTAASAADHSYPLARSVHMVFDHAPGQPLRPLVREFMRFVLSDEGQAVVAREGSYIPLQAEQAQRALKSLD
jgi:phosphate transport system substrate-binding protein